MSHVKFVVRRHNDGNELMHYKYIDKTKTKTGNTRYIYNDKDNKKNENKTDVKTDPKITSTTKVEDAKTDVKNTTEGSKDYAKVVQEILSGKWGNGRQRWDKLTKSGYDWAHAQNLVNEKLGSKKRHATNYKDTSSKSTKSTKKTTKKTTTKTSKKK